MDLSEAENRKAGMHACLPASKQQTTELHVCALPTQKIGRKNIHRAHVSAAGKADEECEAYIYR